jgi:hypothetical protein
LENIHNRFLPTFSKGLEPVSKHIHAQLGGEKQCEKEVQVVEQRKPVH